MAQEEKSAVVNSALTILSVFLILLGIFFILTGVKDIFFNSPAGTVQTDNVEKDGNIGVGISTTRVPSVTVSPAQTNASAAAKATETAKTIEQTGKWTATNYVKGEIGKGEYIVKKGDTLWEIAEAVYGSGFEWKKILEANKGQIGFLKNGSQALIVPGQKLVLV